MYSIAFYRAAADESCRAYQQITGDYSLSGAASPLCNALGLLFWADGQPADRAESN